MDQCGSPTASNHTSFIEIPRTYLTHHFTVAVQHMITEHLLYVKLCIKNKK